jgi:uncharacterized protein (TIGR02118 family)
MSAKVLALYRQPKDPAAFDRYYFDTHVPIAKTLPGLTSYEVSRGGVQALGGPAPPYLVAILSFGSMAAIQAALASPEGQKTAADIANFADGGVDLLMLESETLR